MGENTIDIEKYDEIWSFVEHKLKVAIPTYFKNVLKVCGYNNGITVASIGIEDIEYMETEVRNGNVGKYFHNVDEEKVLEDCTMAYKDFMFTLGHRKWLLTIVNFLKKHLQENGPDKFTIDGDPSKKVKKRAVTKPGPRINRLALSSRKRKSEDDFIVGSIVADKLPIILESQNDSQDEIEDVDKHIHIILTKILEHTIKCLKKPPFTAEMFDQNVESMKKKICGDCIEVKYKVFESDVEPEEQAEDQAGNDFKEKTKLTASVLCLLCNMPILVHHKPTEYNFFIWQTSNFNRHLKNIHLNETTSKQKKPMQEINCDVNCLISSEVQALLIKKSLEQVNDSNVVQKKDKIPLEDTDEDTEEEQRKKKKKKKQESICSTLFEKSIRLEKSMKQVDNYEISAVREEFAKPLMAAVEEPRKKEKKKRRKSESATSSEKSPKSTVVVKSMKQVDNYENSTVQEEVAMTLMAAVEEPPKKEKKKKRKSESATSSEKSPKPTVLEKATVREEFAKPLMAAVEEPRKKEKNLEKKKKRKFESATSSEKSPKSTVLVKSMKQVDNYENSTVQEVAMTLMTAVEEPRKKEKKKKRKSESATSSEKSPKSSVLEKATVREEFSKPVMAAVEEPRKKEKNLEKKKKRKSTVLVKSMKQVDKYENSTIQEEVAMTLMAAVEEPPKKEKKKKRKSESATSSEKSPKSTVLVKSMKRVREEFAMPLMGALEEPCKKKRKSESATSSEKSPKFPALVKSMKQVDNYENSTVREKFAMPPIAAVEQPRNKKSGTTTSAKSLMLVKSKQKLGKYTNVLRNSNQGSNDKGDGLKPSIKPWNKYC